LKVVLVAIIGIGCLLPSLFSSNEGLIEIDHPYAEGTKVKVNVGKVLLFVASKIAGKEDPEAAKFISGLSAVKVRIYDRSHLWGIEPEEVPRFYERQLREAEWDVMVRVREEESNVAVYSLTKGDNISGLVVIVDKPEELIVVNLAGRIDINNLAQINGITDANINLPEHEFDN